MARQIETTTKHGFKTKKDALNYEHEFKATAEERVDITATSLAEKYLEDRKLHLKLKELTPGIVREW